MDLRRCLRPHPRSLCLIFQITSKDLIYRVVREGMVRNSTTKSNVGLIPLHFKHTRDLNHELLL